LFLSWTGLADMSESSTFLTAIFAMGAEN
jgi:hypothetical protein